MIIRIYHLLEKDINSTELPSYGNNYSSHEDLDCQLFEPCSIVAPRIRLVLPMAYNIADVNYAYIDQFRRYYWVQDAEWIEGCWILSLNVDVLSSFKTDIGSSYQYVVRSASSYDGSITDTLYPPNGVTSHKWISMLNLTNPFSPNIANGSFIVGIVGEADTDVGRFGAVNYYQFNLAQFNDFINALMANTGDWLQIANASINDLKSNTLKTILNPMQYITSCQWFPIPANGTDKTSDIKFGWWKITGITHKNPPTSGGYPADNGLIGFSVTSSERHPQAARGSYLNREPYTTYKMYMPMCGYIDMPGRIIAKSGYVGVAYRIDLASGNAMLDVYGKPTDTSPTEYPIMRTNTKISIDVPIAQIAVDTVGTAKSGANTIIGAVTDAITGNIGGMISGLINGGIDTAVKASQPIANIMPSTGSLAPYLQPPAILCEYQNIADEAQTLAGRPLCSYVQLSTLSGYILCNTGHVELHGGLQGEIEQVESFLRSGFFYA